MSTNEFKDANSLSELIEQIGTIACDPAEVSRVGVDAKERLKELGANDLD